VAANNYNTSNYLTPPSSAGFTSPVVEYNANWGVAPKVVSDPQVNIHHERLDSLSDEQSRSEVRRARRKLMADLVSDFAASNDELLRELAR